MKIDRPSRAIVFPGQGSQYVGMGIELAKEYSAARAVFEEVDEALGQSLFKLMSDGPEQDLVLTSNAQPALMAVSIALIRVIEERSGMKIENIVEYFAGHSLGEYSALTAAGSIKLFDAAKLLKLRGQSMQSAVPVGAGAMAALLGADIELARDVAASAANPGVCDVANDNAPGQIVLSGDTETVKKAIEISKHKGVKRAILLPVSAPFHCSLMTPAARVMSEKLKEIEIKWPNVPVVANVLASKIKGGVDDIRESLVAQVTGMVRWRESIIWMVENGINSIVEVGAGQVLTGLNKRIDNTVDSVSIAGPTDISEFMDKFSSLEKI